MPKRVRPQDVIVLSDPKAFGVLVAELRADRGLTQAELAKLVGLSRRTIIKIEQGYDLTHLDWVVALLRVLGAELRAVLK